MASPRGHGAIEPAQFVSGIHGKENGGGHLDNYSRMSDW
jgi:hypothetical protein